MRKLRYFIEFLLVAFFMRLSVLLGPDRASDLGGLITRTIGPKLSVTRKAKRHLNKIFPEFSDDHVQQILIDMWDNIGRTFLEYPHLEYIGKNRVTIIGGEIMESQLASGGPNVMICAHFANWEVAAPAVLMQYQSEMDLIYRAPNNPWVDKILLKHRTLNGKLRAYPKSKSGMREVIEALAQKRNLGILIDQKFNGGLKVDFFGHPAMTSPFFAQISQKYKRPIINGTIVRLGRKCAFNLTIHEPINTDGKQIIDIIAEAHRFLESSIRANPAQWIWLHRRWRGL